MRIALSALTLLLVSLALGLAVSIRMAVAREGTLVSPEVLQRGRQVYEANCAVCHGIIGDGQGMAAHMFRVPPRDFRQGVFKFRSTASGSLPTDHDLLQTVTQGIRWTGMVDITPRKAPRGIPQLGAPGLSRTRPVSDQTIHGPGSPAFAPACALVRRRLAWRDKLPHNGGTMIRCLVD